MTEAQLDGRACIFCGREDGPMSPVASDSWLFAHPDCLRAEAERRRTRRTVEEFYDYDRDPLT